MRDITNADDVALVINTIKSHIRLKEEYNPDDTSVIDVVAADRHGIDRLAECIFEYYLTRTKAHIQSVQAFAKMIADKNSDRPWSGKLLEQAKDHDKDKITDIVFAANYAPYLVKKYGPEELTRNFELTEEYEREFDRKWVVQHCKNNKHHPESFDETYDYGENNPPYTPKMMDEVSMAEMCADFLAVGYEMGNSATEWFDKTNGKRWNWSNSQKTFILGILKDEASFLAKLRSVSAESLTLSAEAIPADVKNAMSDNILYHGSMHRYSTLVSQPQNDIGGKPALSLTPYIGIACCFSVPNLELFPEYKHRYVLVKELAESLAPSDMIPNQIKVLRNKITTVHIVHNVKEIPHIEKDVYGYIHYVHASDVESQSMANPKWKGSGEVLYTGKRLTPFKIEKIKIHMIANYDKQASVDAGGDAILKTSKSSTEALNPSNLKTVWIDTVSVQEVKSGYYRLEKATLIDDKEAKKKFWSCKVQVWPSLAAVKRSISSVTHQSWHNAGFTHAIEVDFNSIKSHIQISGNRAWLIPKSNLSLKILNSVDLAEVYKANKNIKVSKEGLSASTESSKQKQIWNVAKKYYVSKGSHSINHILQVIDHTRRLVTIRKENPVLTDIEFAACAFHDSGLKNNPDRERHHLTSAIVAEKECKRWFNPEDIRIIVSAVREHRASYKGEFTSDVSDLVSSADRNDPDIKIIMARSYKYQIEHGYTEEQAWVEMVKHIKDKYGSNGYIRYPKYYTEYHNADIKKVQRQADTMTVAKAKAILGDYSYESLAPSTEGLLDLVLLGWNAYDLAKGTSNQMKRSEQVKEAVKAHKLWFVASSGKSPVGNIAVSPKYPNDPLVAAKVKDKANKRACCYPSISKALTATHLNLEGKLMYIYCIHRNTMWGYKLGMPTNELVPDASITEELWSAKELWMGYVCTVRVGKPKTKHVVKCRTADGKPYQFTDITWNYEVVDGKSVESLDTIPDDAQPLTPSTEAALPANFKEKRKKIEKYIIDSIKLLDPHSGINTDYWEKKFKSMSDKDFDQFMNYLKDHKTNIHMFVPPLKVHLKSSELIDAAHKLNVKLMHRIWMTDEATGLRYLTPEEYLVLQLPVRRQQQFLDEKISVPDNDKTVDALTGQVTGDSAACGFTNPEIHIMQARNLDASLYEFVNVRGGNIPNYAEFKRSLEETGSVSLNKLDPNNRTRVSVMAGVLLTGMHLDSNFNDNII